MRKTVAVFGSAIIKKDSRDYSEAVEIGNIIGCRGYDILCGGYGGIMEAVCKGVTVTGRRCYGIGLTDFKSPPNKYISNFTKVKTLGKRLDYFEKHADIFLGLYGGIGTITEIMFFWDIAKAGIFNKTPILLYGDRWNDFIKLLKNDFIITDSSFKLIKVLKSHVELSELLKNKGI